jgi:SAM-dependent methyltransferase
MQISCPNCVNSNIIFLYKRNGFDIYQCHSCRMGITNIPEDFNLLSIYNEDYYQGRQDDGYSDYIGSETSLRKEFQRDVKLLLKQFDNKKKLTLLEIGCAYGFFLEESKAHFEVQGIEVAKDAVEFCKSRGLKVLEGVLDRKQCERFEKFDIITFLDVIEHIPNPNEFFNNLNLITKSGSKLLITTGDFGSLFSKLTGKHWRLMTPPQHVFFYTRKSITKLLNTHGFEVNLIYTPSKIVPFDLIFFQLRRIIGLNIKTPKFLKDKEIKINLFDSMKVIATKI